MNSWFSISAKGEGVSEITIYDEIGAEGVTAKSFLDALKSVGDHKIKLRINSPGGSVFDGLAIYNRLREHKGGVEVHIDGLAASMASVIAMTGAPVFMAENALFMLHNPSGLVLGDAESMRTMSDILDKCRDCLVTAYVRKTSLGADRIIAMMDAETWLSASQAKAFGFVDEITNEMALAAHFDTSKFLHAPAALHTPSLPSALNMIAVRDARIAELEAQLRESAPALIAARAELETVNARLATSERNVRLIEGYCGVKGIDPRDVPAAVPEPTCASIEDIDRRLSNARTPEEKANIMEELRKAHASGGLK